MNKDIFEGKWKQIRGEAKAWWGKLTDDDLDRAAGKFDVLAGMLQEKYGYTREAAADEIDKRVTEYESNLSNAMPEKKVTGRVSNTLNPSSNLGTDSTQEEIGTVNNELDPSSDQGTVPTQKEIGTVNNDLVEKIAN